ncbi:MAG: hypothetical protein JO257_28465 [Deltaproteobacteria bacterium]|nr:hypothetical protein [Deltaproteobacteria bacterium]
MRRLALVIVAACGSSKPNPMTKPASPAIPDASNVDAAAGSAMRAPQNATADATN